jgi:uncharacterized linocin/CFP29 family protein
MNHLHRELAPISEAVWAEIEGEAKRTLTASLAARKIVDFVGPKGLGKSAVRTGRQQSISAGPDKGIEASLRELQPLVEIRVPFELDRKELDAIDRGAKDADLDPVVAAAQRAALFEDRAVFHGHAPALIRGICESAGETISLTENYEDYPNAVARALARLRSAGVDGPYAIALGRQCYTGITETTKGGYPVIQHVKRLTDGPLVFAPAVDGAAVVSMRGDDFELTVGQDLSIGYLDHDREKVRLYIQETFTFRVLTPHAAVPLSYGRKSEKKGRG